MQTMRMQRGNLKATRTSGGTRRGQAAAIGATVAGLAAVGTWYAVRRTRRRMPSEQWQAHEGTMRVEHGITIRRSREDLYRAWRDFSNLPRFMQHLESVQVMGATRSHWKAKAPAGATVEWDAEIIEDRPGEGITWRSLPGSGIGNIGSVRFADAPGDRGTEVRVTISYDPPAGALGAGVAKLLGEAPDRQVPADLRRFKQVMETGEVTLSEAMTHPSGKGPARPPKQPPEPRPTAELARA